MGDLQDIATGILFAVALFTVGYIVGDAMAVRPVACPVEPEFSCSDNEDIIGIECRAYCK